MNNPLNVNTDIIEKFTNEELEKLYLQVNLPDKHSSYLSGNGEGCWAIPLTKEDKVFLDEDKPNTTAKIILCNGSVYFPPIVYGTVLQVEIRSGKRPVLDIEWMQKQLKDSGVDFKADALGM